MARAFGITLLVLMIFVGACSGGGDDRKRSGEPADSEAENELAASLLLTVEDFPTGWAEDTSDDEEATALEECEAGPAPGRTGAAETGNFSMGGTSEVSELLAVFQSTDAAKDALDRIETQGNCAVDIINDGKLDDSEWEFSDASFSRASFPPYGDVSEAYRLEAHVKVKGETGLGSEGSFYFHYVAVAKGRFAFVILAADIFSPFESTLLELIVEAAAKKIPNGAEPKTPSVATPTRAPTVAPTPTAAPLGGSRENPVPLGEIGTLADRLQAKVVAVNGDAWPVVQAENQFNEPPEPGKRMVMVTLEVTNVGTDSLEVSFEPTYGLVGDKAVVYDNFGPSCGVIPDGLEGELFPGGTKQGSVCFQADTDDANLVLFIEMFTAAFEQERLFLALQ